jgi:hypothetical protein
MNNEQDARYVPAARPRPLGSFAQIHVNHESYTSSDGLFEKNGFGGTIVDRWVEIFTDSFPGQDDTTLAEYVYLVRSPSDDEEYIVRERWLS